MRIFVKKYVELSNYLYDNIQVIFGVKFNLLL